jgi:peptidoglycan/xylan/chitin deacetylase (PgdA/CDA1 family)
VREQLSRRNALKLGAGAAIAGVAGLLLPDEASAINVDPDIFHGPRSRSEVAITFHGQGDLVIARKILAISKKYSAPISVMAVGTWLNANPTIGHEIVDAGNDLGNHTYSHKTMTLLSLKEATTEVAKGKAAVVKSVGTAGKWFRPSGTLKSNANIRAAAGASGYTHCLVYDVDSFDYQNPSAKTIVATCMKTVQNGSIIGMHFGHAHTVTALPLLIQALQAKGLTPVTVTQLLR